MFITNLHEPEVCGFSYFGNRPPFLDRAVGERAKFRHNLATLKGLEFEAAAGSSPAAVCACGQIRAQVGDSKGKAAEDQQATQ
jgi:hypothetical protein